MCEIINKNIEFSGGLTNWKLLNSVQLQGKVILGVQDEYPIKIFQERILVNVINNETHLLYSVLCYEEGHCRRTQHILKVYALAKLFGEQEKISVEDQQILQAAAILHDVAIKYCKEHYNGDASQNNQKQVVSILVTRF